MAGEDALAWIKRDLEFLNKPYWEERLLGALLYGTWARGEESPGSDIDLCIVVPQTPGRAALWREFVSHLRDPRYEVRIFDMLPLHIKIAVIDEGVVLQSRDDLELWEYFSPFRREWEDQKHRHMLDPEEMRSLIAAGREARACGKN